MTATESEKDKGPSVLVGNYGFVYVAPSILKKLRVYLGRKEWKRVGAVSLIVKPGGQYFQVSDVRFKRMMMIPLAKVVEL